MSDLIDQPPPQDTRGSNTITPDLIDHPPPQDTRGLNTITPDLMDQNAGSDETPNEGLGQNSETEEGRSMIVDVASDGSEEGEVKDDGPVITEQEDEVSPDLPVTTEQGDEVSPDLHEGSKRRRSLSNEDGRKAKRIMVPESLIESFEDAFYPPRKIPCMVSIDGREPFGSLYRTNGGFAILLFIDPRRYGSPTVALTMRIDGSEKGNNYASNTWDLESNVRGNYAISNLVHGYASPGAADARMADPKVLDTCDREDMRFLMYMRFDSWANVLGFYRQEVYDRQSPSTKKSIAIMFKPKRPYQVEFWFIAPCTASKFRSGCMKYFTDGLNHRLRAWD